MDLPTAKKETLFSSKPIRHELNNNIDEEEINILEQFAFNSGRFRDKVVEILHHHNINTVDSIAKGGFSWVADIGENQVMRIYSPRISPKPDIRFNEPEILQPLAYLHYADDLVIEILPKVKTTGITNDHVFSLVSSLAKKGALFADCHKSNIGLITVGNKEIPVVIGSNCVIEMEKYDLNKRYYWDNTNYEGEYVKNNLHFFSLVIKRYFPELAKKYENNPQALMEYFKNNENYVKHPWGDHENRENWAQNKFVKEKDLPRDNGDGQYRIKGAIHSNTLAKLRDKKSNTTPLANKFIDTVCDNRLRKKDADEVAANIISGIINERNGSMESFTNFITERKNSKDNELG